MWGTVAFASVVLTSFLQFLFVRQFYGEAWQVFPTFALGALYLVAGVMSSRCVEPSGPVRGHTYYLAQTVLVAGILFLSPARGLFGIIVLPLVSQAMFLFRFWTALLAVAGIYLLTVSVFWIPWGWSSAFDAFLSFSPAFFFTTTFSYATRTALDARERSEALRAELEKANALLRDQAAQAHELATIRERNRLSREIHDGLGHYLTVINVQLEAARSIFEKDPAKTRQALDRAARLSREALDEVRASVRSLREDGQREPLPNVLERLVADAALPITLTIKGAVRPLASAADHALYRAAQEGLTNARKHAGAGTTQVALTLDYGMENGDRVALTVEDNGLGAKGDAPSAGFGLRGLRERVDLLGGVVQAGPAPPGGFCLSVTLPSG